MNRQFNQQKITSLFPSPLPHLRVKKTERKKTWRGKNWKNSFHPESWKSQMQGDFWSLKASPARSCAEGAHRKCVFPTPWSLFSTREAVICLHVRGVTWTVALTTDQETVDWSPNGVFLRKCARTMPLPLLSFWIFNAYTVIGGTLCEWLSKAQLYLPLRQGKSLCSIRCLLLPGFK